MTPGVNHENHTHFAQKSTYPEIFFSILLKIMENPEKQQGSTLGAKIFLKNRGSLKIAGMWTYHLNTMGPWVPVKDPRSKSWLKWQ